VKKTTKKSVREFVGRVLWYDTTTSHDYQHDSIPDPKDRMGKFAEYGIINLENPDAIVVKFGIEHLDFKSMIVKSVRDVTDIPRGKKIIYKVQEHLGGNKWKDVKIKT
jgi:hypothetical protein